MGTVGRECGAGDIVIGLEITLTDALQTPESDRAATTTSGQLVSGRRVFDAKGPAVVRSPGAGHLAGGGVPHPDLAIIARRGQVASVGVEADNIGCHGIFESSTIKVISRINLGSPTEVRSFLEEQSFSGLNDPKSLRTYVPGSFGLIIPPEKINFFPSTGTS